MVLALRDAVSRPDLTDRLRRFAHALDVSESSAADILATFELLWSLLGAPERHALVRMLVKRVTVNGDATGIRVELHGAASTRSREGITNALTLETPRPTRKRPTSDLDQRPPARLARTLALAHHLQRRLECGDLADHTAIARQLGISRSRVSQLMAMTLLAPDLQEQILFLEKQPGQRVNERVIRLVLRSMSWSDQRRAWQRMTCR